MPNPRTLTVLLAPVAALVVLAGVIGPGCAPRPRTSMVISEAAIHAVHSDRLAEVMDSLAKPADNLPKELDVAGDRQRKISEVSAIASQMAVAAAAIPDVLVDVDLTQEQKQAFLDLAELLERQARELEEHANKGDFSQVAKVREQLNETCDFCHRRFRVLPLVTD